MPLGAAMPVYCLQCAHVRHTHRVTLIVWVDRWHQHCCGQPWDVGATVSWTLTEPDQDFLAPLFPDAAGVVIE